MFLHVPIIRTLWILTTQTLIQKFENRNFLILKKVFFLFRKIVQNVELRRKSSAIFGPRPELRDQANRIFDNTRTSLSGFYNPISPFLQLVNVPFLKTNSINDVTFKFIWSLFILISGREGARQIQDLINAPIRI